MPDTLSIDALWEEASRAPESPGPLDVDALWQAQAPATVSPEFRGVLKDLEGFTPEAKWDYKQHSIGYGTRGKPGEKITRQQADLRLEDELAVHAAKVDDAARRFGYDLTQNQRDALISFDFNTGAAERALGFGSGDLALVKSKMAEYVKAGGQTLPGLEERRRKELAWFDRRGGATEAGEIKGIDLDELWDGAAPEPMTRAEFGAQQQQRAGRTLAQKADEFATGMGEGLRRLGGTVLDAGRELIADPAESIMSLPANVVEGATRGTFDLVDIGRRVLDSDLAALTPGALLFPEGRKKIKSVMGLLDKEEKLTKDYDKYLTNSGWQQARAEGLDGQGNVAPQWFGTPQPAVSEGLSLVLDPTLAVPLAGQATRLAGAGRRALARGAAPVARGIETGGRAVNQTVTGGLQAFTDAIERTGIDATTARAGVGMLGGASLLSTPGQILGSTMGAAKGAELGAAATRAVAEEFPIASQLRISERIARDVNRPTWLRRAAQAATGIPEPLTRSAGAAVEGAAQGAVIGGALGFLAEGDAREIGAGVGSGGLLGAAGGAIGAQLPAARAAARTRGEAGDIVRMLDRQETLGGSAERIAALPRDQQLRIATLDRILSDGADLIALDGFAFAEATGQPGAAGVFRATGPDGRQRLFVNLDGGVSPVRSLAHEVGHALATHPAVNRDANHLAIDTAYGTAGLEARGREYAQRLLEAEGTAPLTPETVEARFEQLRTEAAARGDVDGLGWVRDEIFAEHLAAEIDGKGWGIDRMKGQLPPGADVSRLRETWWDIKQRLLDAFGVPYTDTGRLALPESTIFRDNPLLGDPALRRMVARAQEERTGWLRGLTKSEEADTPRGAPLMRSAGAQSLASNPAVEWRPRGDGTWETDFAVRDAAGRVTFKDPAEIARAETARQEQGRALVPKTTLPAGDPRLAPKVIDGRTVISGDTLPPLFDHSPHFFAETKRAARAMEAARGDGGTFSLWYHQIGSGTGGNWRQAVRQRLGNVQATQREVSLVGWEVTKAGNIVAKVLDVGAARQRAFELAEAGRLEMWGGSVDAFQADVRTYLANHAAGQPGETGIGQPKRDFINGFFGVSTRANRAANPIHSGAFGRSLIKSFRLDRMNRVEPTNRTGWAVNYPRMRDNLLPAAAPNFLDKAREKMQNAPADGVRNLP